MFGRVLDTPLSNNLLYLTESLRRSFPPLGLHKGILHSLYLLIPSINIKSENAEPCSHTKSWFPWVSPWTKRQNIWSSFICSFVCERSFDQELWSSLTYFFYLHTTIRPKYMVFFHLFFLLCTTIRLKIMALFNLFLLFTHDDSTKNYSPHWFIFFMCKQPFDQNIWSSFIYLFYLHTTIRPKYTVLFHLFFL